MFNPALDTQYGPHPTGTVSCLAPNHCPANTIYVLLAVVALYRVSRGRLFAGTWFLVIFTMRNSLALVVLIPS